MKKISIYSSAIRKSLSFKKTKNYKYFLRYIGTLNEWFNAGGKVTHVFPILSEFKENAGTASGHYFHQDLLVAAKIYHASPARHIDVGSRIDGFVAHVASFRKIEVIDVRDLPDVGHANISFLKMDMSGELHSAGISDSISCLHAIEHFGLGRYGDPVDPLGYLKGFSNLVEMLQPGGVLYISFPIGQSNEIHFNAHRVFHPTDVFSWPIPVGSSLKLLSFDYVDDNGQLHRSADPLKISKLPKYGCGIYSFLKE
jgi:hypothetical protein